MANANRQRNELEHGEQVTFFDWVRFRAKSDPRFACIFAVPNAGKRPGTTGNWYKAEGLMAGVPDIMVLVPALGAVGYDRAGDVGYGFVTPGLVIEMKAPGREKEKNGGVSDEQLEWIQRLSKQGYKCVVCYGFDQAQAVLCEYLGVTPNA